MRCRSPKTVERSCQPTEYSKEGGVAHSSTAQVVALPWPFQEGVGARGFSLRFVATPGSCFKAGSRTNRCIDSSTTLSRCGSLEMFECGGAMARQPHAACAIAMDRSMKGMSGNVSTLPSRSYSLCPKRFKFTYRRSKVMHAHHR